MGQVLVIKNADFNDNRVAVISFDGKPCTGIELEQSSITVTGNQPVTVAYTVTPSDTTDSIVWASSDQSVATVEGNVLTIVGIGSTTITATCGSFSDSLTLTADLYASPNWFGTSGSSSIITDSSDNSIARLNGKSDLSSNRMVAVQTESSRFSIPLFDGNNVISAYPIAIPNNVGKIHIDATQGLYNGDNSLIFFNGNESVTYAGSTTSCLAISTAMVTASSNKINVDITTIPTGANAFILDARLSSSTGSGRTADQAAEYCGISIHFLPNE